MAETAETADQLKTQGMMEPLEHLERVEHLARYFFFTV